MKIGISVAVKGATLLGVFVFLALVTVFSAKQSGAMPEPRLIYRTETGDPNESDGNDIYSISPDGTNKLLLGQCPGECGFPKWWPDGTKASYLSYEDNELIGAFSVNSDGTNTMEVENEELVTGDWSPDGSKIAYPHWIEGVGYELHVANSDGTNDQVFDEESYNIRSAMYPSWSPDGETITYMCVVQTPFTGQFHICRINADGTGFVNLTVADFYYASDPRWSPDGEKIVFNCSPSPGSLDVCVANADGTGLEKIGDSMNSPDWSPDGTRIVAAYDEPENNYSMLLTMNPDGSGRQNLDVTGYAPILWSPDGSKIAYTEQEKIWVVNPDGTGAMNLTSSEGNDLYDYSWTARDLLVNDDDTPTTPGGGTGTITPGVPKTGRLIAASLVSLATIVITVLLGKAISARHIEKIHKESD